MKCPDAGILQAYIDCELEIEQKKDVERHILTCSKCSAAYSELKNNDDFTFTKIINYRQYYEERLKPRSVPVGIENPKSGNLLSTKGVISFMNKYKKFAAVAGIAIAVTTCITIQPVRAAIESALSIFRVENVKGITVTLEDLQQIRNKLVNGQGEIDLDKMGSIKMQGGQRRVSSPEDAGNLPDIAVAFPSAISGVTPSVTVIEPRTIDFTLNVKNVNQIMKTYGAEKLLPDNIDGKTFKIDFATQVTTNYQINDKSIEIIQTKSPQITVPEGVNVDEVYDAIVEMPILPDNLQSQLKSIKDWKNTLYIPVVESTMTEVEINGAKGYMASDMNKATNTPHSQVIWYNDRVIYIASGPVDGDEILNIARSMK